MELLLILLGGIAACALYWQWQKKQRRKQLLALYDHAAATNRELDELTNFEKYFAYRGEQNYTDTHNALRSAIGENFEHLRLPANVTATLHHFCECHDNIADLRQRYNNDFVQQESEKYADLFSGLEAYPLSADQVEAVIRDEDNNLVIAGAGTGKTTTIAAKVAYLLEKGLARPEEMLIISFTKNAVREMQERCQRFCGESPEIRTFNSFGFLVSRTCSDRELLLAFDGNEDAAKTFLQEQFDALFINDRGFQRKAVNYLAFFERPERDESAFKTRNDHYRYEQGFKNVTLDGVNVNSKEEVEIANFFCLFNITYEYQRHYPLQEADRNANYGAYQPDFYLPDHQLWLEHFGINRNGEVPDWFGSTTEYYRAGMAWKEGIHAKYGTKLLRTYSYEAKERTLLQRLKTQLVAEGVELKEHSPEEMLELFKAGEQYRDYMDLVHTFLGLMKCNGMTPAQLAPKTGDKRFKVFLAVFEPLFRAYEQHLKRIPAVDYHDMVNHAAAHFRHGKFTKPYKYILVDEFQDMSLGRYELLKAIRQQNPGVKLYAVGDDWQSIFRFTGSDISIITRFEQHFGFTSQTAILQTYRFNEQILAASSSFIQQNPAQFKKQLTTLHEAPEGHTSFAYNSGSLKEILASIAVQKADATVFLIGRYTFNVPKDLKVLRYQFDGLRISFYTAHAVKGMTCDYAILLDVDAGILGFPSEMADDPMLGYLLQEGDRFPNAEERRVFYVAITRARYKNYFLYNENHPSKFVLELQGVETTQPELLCPECRGQLIKRAGPYSEFYGCVHYPRCNGKLAIPV